MSQPGSPAACTAEPTPRRKRVVNAEPPVAVVGKRTPNGAGTSDLLSSRSLASTRPSRAALQSHVCPPDVSLTATFFRGEVTTKSSKLQIKTIWVRRQRPLEAGGEGWRPSGASPAGRLEKLGRSARTWSVLLV